MAKGFDSLRKKLEEYGKRAENMGDIRESVGFFAGQQYEDGTPVAYVAAIQEFGAPSVSIPPRPFFRPTIAAKKGEWGRQMAIGARAVVRGSASASDVMSAVGELAVADIKEAISSVQSPALSPVTVMLRGMRQNDANLHVTGKTVGEAAARVAAGETNYGASSKPLEDTFTMFDSVTHAQERVK